MADYTRLKETDARALMKPYLLGNVTSVTPIHGGAENSSFVIRTEQGSFCLTVYNLKPVEQVLLLSRILDHLQEHRFLSTPLMKAGHHNLVLYQGKPVIVKEFIDGEVYERLTEEMMEQVGETIAMLHQIPLIKGLPKEHPYSLNAFGDVLLAGLDHPFCSWLEEQAASLASRIPRGLPRAFVHGDLFYDNLIFQGDKLAAIIDFEETSESPAVFDLGMCALGSCFDDGRLNLSKVSAMVRGYRKRRTLLPVEMGSLQTMIELGATATAFWRFRQYHIIKPEPDLFDRHEEIVVHAQRVRGIPADEFQRAVTS